MFRIFVLLLFTYFFFHLHVSGNLSKYINMKYSYLSYSAIWILAFLTIVQIITYFKQSEKENCHSDCCCDHEHEHESKKPFYKRMIVYMIFFFPLITGFFLPIATLDSNIVKAKGFSFKAIESNEQYAQTQYLRPDTSVYYGKEGYDELMAEEFKKYSRKNTISLHDEDYLKGMETIYNYPGDFLDKTVEFNGFTYKGDALNNKQMFILRFGIIHCVADSGVFGMLVEFPNNMKLKDDEWVHVKGSLSSIYYQPFKAAIPVLQVKEWSKIKKPDDPYVYRGY
ncbi:TIGR03943 family putative permease subunit [Metabacillus fastidiosus]|uniref:TIGR03943 family putative permease subunit n=1 Tax=Metabacillus fastidiosus TaxID=1458 RepID=UPI002E217BCA|nr:TIGR03943 family protein [Metabacillus fastidiosus]